MAKHVGYVKDTTHASMIGGADRRNIDIKKIVTDANRPELSLPTARLDSPVPYVIGRVRVTSPNFIWFGNVRNIIEETTDTVTETRKTQIGGELGGLGVRYDYITTETINRKVVGYTLDYALAICLGPGVELLAIYSGDVLLWQGALGVGRTEVNGHDIPELGTDFVFHSGEFTQAPDPYLLPIVGADYLPGFVGVSYIIVKGVDASLVSGGNLSFEVRRLPNTLALVSGNVLAENDVNAASTMADIIENEWGAIGVDPSLIDVASFTTAAAVFAGEGIACAFANYSENFGVSLLRQIQEQTRSIIFVDPDSAKIKIKALRSDPYNPADLLRLDNSNIASLQRMEKSAWAELPTHFKVEYTNRATAYAADKLLTVNPAVTPSPTRERRVGSISLAAACEPGIAAASLALFLTYEASPQLSFTVQANRQAADLLPGDTVLVSYDEYGMTDFPATVLKVREQGSTSNAVVIELTQYENAQVSDFHTLPEVSAHVAADLSPKPPIDALVIGAPYFFLNRTGFEQPLQFYSPLSFPLVMVAMENDFQIVADVELANGSLLREDMAVPLAARLVGTIAKFDGYDNYTLPSITIDNVVNAFLLIDQMESGVRAGNRFILIDNEILSYETYTDNGDGSFTLNTVYRALIDTPLEEHADNARVFIIDESNTRLIQLAVEMFDTKDLNIYSRSHKGRGRTPLAVSYTGTNRSNAPYRPTMTMLDGVRTSVERNVDAGANYLIAFTPRPRLIPGVVLSSDAPDVVIGYETLQGTTDVITTALTMFDSLGNYFFLGTSEYGEVTGAFSEYTPYDLRVVIPPTAAPGPARIDALAVRMTELGATPVADQETHIVQWSHGYDTIPVYVNPPVALSADFMFEYAIQN